MVDFNTRLKVGLGDFRGLFQWMIAVGWPRNVLEEYITIFVRNWPSSEYIKIKKIQNQGKLFISE